MINSIIDIISFFISIGIFIWIGIFLIKLALSKDKRKNKEIIKIINNFEEKFKSFYKYLFRMLGMLINMIVSIVLAVGSEPIIYKLNAPLGEGYSTFASYVVAIAIYILLPKWFIKADLNETGERQ